MWDPTKRRDVVVHELECSRDDRGVAQGSVTLRPWSTRERLAFQDAAAMNIALSTDDTSGQQVRKVRVSAVQLAHLRLTVAGCHGFPEVDGKPFDFSNPDHVGVLDEVTFDEVVEAATTVQPMPTGKVAKPTDRKPPAAAGEPGEDFEVSDEDPSRTR